MRIHADLAFDCDVLSWDQPFENAAFVGEVLESQFQLSVLFSATCFPKKDHVRHDRHALIRNSSIFRRRKKSTFRTWGMVVPNETLFSDSAIDSFPE